MRWRSPRALARRGLCARRPPRPAPPLSVSTTVSRSATSQPPLAWPSTRSARSALPAPERRPADRGLARRRWHATDGNRHERALRGRAAAAVGRRHLALEVMAGVLAFDGVGRAARARRSGSGLAATHRSAVRWSPATSRMAGQLLAARGRARDRWAGVHQRHLRGDRRRERLVCSRCRPRQDGSDHAVVVGGVRDQRRQLRRDGLCAAGGRGQRRAGHRLHRGCATHRCRIRRSSR